MPILPKLIYKFNETPIRILSIFVKTEKLILKLMWKCQGPNIAKIIWKKNIEDLTVIDFKNYYKATLIHRVRYWWKDTCRWIEQNIYTSHTSPKLLKLYFFIVIIMVKPNSCEWTSGPTWSSPHLFQSQWSPCSNLHPRDQVQPQNVLG